MNEKLKKVVKKVVKRVKKRVVKKVENLFQRGLSRLQIMFQFYFLFHQTMIHQVFVKMLHNNIKQHKVEGRNGYNLGMMELMDFY